MLGSGFREGSQCSGLGSGFRDRVLSAGFSVLGSGFRDRVLSAVY